MAISGQEAWRIYKDIERVIETRYDLPKNRIDYDDTTMALQRLGEAVLLRYKLDPADHSVRKRWNITIKLDSKIKLSTEEDMLRAHITEWEEAIPFEKAGYDTWSGRHEGYYKQKSLQQTLDQDYKTIKQIVDATPDSAWDLLTQIENIVQIEILRLGNDPKSQGKITEIESTIADLHQAVIYKYKKQELSTLSHSNQLKVDSADIYSYTTMLDLKLHKWSLRQALNLSTYSVASQMFGLQEAWWGKATALENVEAALFHR